MINAPEIDTPFGWLNTKQAYSLKKLRGKIVLLDFWTFGCINCQHIIPDLKRLEKEYAQELVVIGVHSAKFDNEKTRIAIQKAILKFGIEHPVVNDADLKLWDQYAVKAWPTLVLINPKGKIIKHQAGERVYEVMQPLIEALIREFGDAINRDALDFQLEQEINPQSKLRFPSKMIFEENEQVIYLSDSGHNRILKINLDGQILEIIGQGTQGFQDGCFEQCTFYEPQGLALHKNFLYIADTKNNALRKANLQTRTLQTIAGDGSLDYYFYDKRWGEAVKPNSPWDLIIQEPYLYVASAGNHQILRMHLASEEVQRWAGMGQEVLVDGPLRESGFNQPSGLSLTNNKLYVADSEASAIRMIDLNQEEVQTILGRGLFIFGDKDGDVDQALLQHCVGLTVQGSLIYLADTYNGKVKVLDLEAENVRTIIAGLDEPNDLLLINSYLWITNTNRHELMVVDLKSYQKEIVNIYCA